MAMPSRSICSRATLACLKGFLPKPSYIVFPIIAAATRAAVVAMLSAGDERSASARACAIERIKASGVRDYGDAATERLRLLLQARRSGMSIAEVKTLTAAFDDGTLTHDLQLKLLREKLANLDQQARALDAARTTIAVKIADLESRKQAAPEVRP